MNHRRGAEVGREMLKVKCDLENVESRGHIDPKITFSKT